MTQLLRAFRGRLAALPQPGSVSLITSEAGVARLTLCNAARRNSLTGPMMASLADAVEDLERRAHANDLWAVVLSGEGGRAFCAGADLSLALEAIDTQADAELMSQLMTDTLNRLRELPLLSVSAVDGPAMGGGAELCTATDWRVFGAGARVQFVQTRMAASTGWGGAARLVSLVGRSEALRLLLHGPPLDASAACALGLCDAVAEPGESAADAAHRLLLGPAREQAGSAASMRAVKASIAGCTAVTVDAARAETDAFGSVWGTGPNRAALEAAAARIRLTGGAHS